MPAKNDLSAFQPKATNKSPMLAPATASKTPQSVPKAVAESRGRKAKPAGEKESETVAFKLTPANANKLKERAGLVPVGTFIKDVLRKNGYID